jgi:hypothetical protein
MNEGYLGADEREVLEAEMTLFAAEIVSDRISRADEERRVKGTEDTEDIDISGNIDGTPYRVVIPSNANKKEE